MEKNKNKKPTKAAVVEPKVDEIKPVADVATVPAKPKHKRRKKPATNKIAKAVVSEVNEKIDDASDAAVESIVKAESKLKKFVKWLFGVK